MRLLRTQFLGLGVCTLQQAIKTWTVGKCGNMAGLSSKLKTHRLLQAIKNQMVGNKATAYTSYFIPWY